MTALLDVRELSVDFGGQRAVDRVSFTVGAGCVVGLIGPNGAGKTTLIDAVTGFVPVAHGSIEFDGHVLDGLAPHDRAGLGLARSFQSLELFEDLTVRDNLLVAAEGTAVRSQVTARVDAAVALLGLGPLADRRPVELSHADRKLAAAARAVAAGPRLLLLDEPAAGLDAPARAALRGQLRRIASAGIAVLLVDHDTGLVFDVCDDVVVLDMGRVIAHGSPATVRTDARVVAAYLGGGGASVRRPPRAAAADAGPRHGTRALLDVRGLSAGYGGVPALHGIDLVVSPGEVVALLGANGAGKTTLLLAVSGIVAHSGGEVSVLGARVGMPAHRLARLGLAHVPQDRVIFRHLSVRENLRLAARGRRVDGAGVLELFPALRPLLGRPAGALSGGEQQMLALAGALVTRPRLLLVDELSLGLAPRVAEQLLGVLARLAAEDGTGILLVEQHVEMALSAADRAYVLERGRIVLAGPAAELSERADLLYASYLGGAPPSPVADGRTD